MTKTTTILIMMALAMLVPVMAAATLAEEEGNELQATAFNNQDDKSQSQQTDKINTTFVIIGLALLGLWYYKQKNGGNSK